MDPAAFHFNGEIDGGHGHICVAGTQIGGYVTRRGRESFTPPFVPGGLVDGLDLRPVGRLGGPLKD
jgi:hypothetical protein